MRIFINEILDESSAEESTQQIINYLYNRLNNVARKARDELDFVGMQKAEKMIELLQLTPSETKAKPVASVKYTNKIKYTFAKKASDTYRNFILGHANDKGQLLSSDEKNNSYIYAFKPDDAEFILQRASLLQDLMLEVVK